MLLIGLAHSKPDAPTAEVSLHRFAMGVTGIYAARDAVVTKSEMGCQALLRRP